ncbi:hypothetical protein Pyrfu_1010 [Pyrolobus fumarii 1A]|uniref:Uncharacterized protein n=1 Tax=Pyrolobus fumarii (strain DSM 11204 / 1A) TaxID=694429 RepID=G0EEQ6_PYRF1|nr:hypothetical protein [Pyrolobus fumarii]AEM38878.1 hypothetical protein Pyrfu_1010 [Pyrolobus fumarii 1A]
MPVDITFELSYLLSDKLGVDVNVENVDFTPGDGTLCVDAVVEGSKRRGCVQVKPCKNITEEHKWVRCVSKNIANNDKLLEELARALRGGDGGRESSEST